MHLQNTLRASHDKQVMHSTVAEKALIPGLKNNKTSATWRSQASSNSKLSPNLNSHATHILYCQQLGTREPPRPAFPVAPTSTEGVGGTDEQRAVCSLTEVTMARQPVGCKLAEHQQDGRKSMIKQICTSRKEQTAGLAGVWLTQPTQHSEPTQLT